MMAEYHVGCGAFGIYAGTLNKKKDRWQNKLAIIIAGQSLEKKSTDTLQ